MNENYIFFKTLSLSFNIGWSTLKTPPMIWCKAATFIFLMSSNFSNIVLEVNFYFRLKEKASWANSDEYCTINCFAKKKKLKKKKYRCQLHFYFCLPSFNAGEFGNKYFLMICVFIVYGFTANNKI